MPDKVIDDLLDVARWTGSSGNTQPWELILVRDRRTLEALAAVDGPPGPGHLAGAALAVFLVLSRESTAFDEGRLAERIMLTAAAKTMLDIPTDRALRTTVSIGYPADAAPGWSAPNGPWTTANHSPRCGWAANR